MADWLGDYTEDHATVTCMFTTHSSTGAPVAPLTGFEAADVIIYKNGSGTQKTSTNGVTMTSPFDSITGLHCLVIDTSNDTGDAAFWVAGNVYTLVLSPDTETVDSVAVAKVIGQFGIELAGALRPTTASRKLDVSTGGEAGIDWANVGSPTTSLALTGTTIAVTQKVDVDTIKTNPVVNGGTITFPTTATLASTTNITAGTITTATNVTTVNGLAAAVITAASIAADAITAAKVADGTIDAATFAAGAINAAAIAADAITDAKVASDVTIASVTGAVGSVTGAVGSVTGNVGGNVTGSVGSVATGGIVAASFAAGAIDNAAIATDAIGSAELAASAASEIGTAVWATATRELTAGTNIVLAKGTGVTGFNDLSAAQVNAEADTALSDYDAPTHAELTAELATADDATLAQVALVKAKTDLIPASPAAVGSAMTLTAAYDAAKTAATQTSVDDLPTNAELATALGSADDAVLAAIAALNNISAAAVNAEVDTALADVGLTTTITGRIDAAVTSRMASYTQPTGFLAATFPSDPADQSLIIAAADALATLIGDVPTNGELATALAGADDATLAAIAALSIPTANQNADALLDRTDAVEVGLTPRQAMRLSAAADAGKISGADTSTNTIRNAVADSKDRIVATVDDDGNRTAITYDLT